MLVEEHVWCRNLIPVPDMRTADKGRTKAQVPRPKNQVPSTKAQRRLPPQLDRYLRCVEHRSIVVAGSPFEQRRRARLNLAVEDHLAVRRDLDRLTEIERIR